MSEWVTEDSVSSSSAFCSNSQACLCCNAGEMSLFGVLLALDGGPLNIVNTLSLDNQASKLLTVHILMVCISLLSYIKIAFQKPLC